MAENGVVVPSKKIKDSKVQEEVRETENKFQFKRKCLKIDFRFRF